MVADNFGISQGSMSKPLRELSPDQRAGLFNGLAMLSQVFWGPNPESCQEMVSREYIADWESLIPLLDEPGAEAARDLVQFLGRFSEAEDLFQSLEPDYIRLFINAPGGVTAPLYHSCYDDEEGLLMGRPAIMMRRRLEEAGLDQGSSLSEPPDHLAVELEYLTLYLDEAYLRSDPAMQREAGQFATSEMLPWVRLFADRLAHESSSGFYRAAARLLVSLLSIASA